MEQKYKRWYDYDSELLKLINILKDYQDELRQQAELFLQQIENKVSREALDKFYAQTKQLNGGKRWYDNDPVISKTIELLRIIPQDVQRAAAVKFIEELKSKGISINN